MMRRTARSHETLASAKFAGVDPTIFSFAQPGDHVQTIDGPGVVADVYDGRVAGDESYYIVLDNGRGEGEYASGDVSGIIPDEFTVEARRYSQVPMACDVCGAPASKSSSGGTGGHTMLCPDCIKERDRTKNASRGETGTRTAARANLPLLAPEELQASGVRTAAEDYPQLGEILWERPDWVEAEPVEAMPRRITLGSKQPTTQTDGGEQISRTRAAEVMFGTGSPQHLKAIERFGPDTKTAAADEPEWLRQRKSNPIKDSLNDKNQPWWWRKVVGPSMDRYNDSVTPDRQIQTMEDLHRIDSPSWCRFRRKGECYFPKEFDYDGAAQAGYAVWIPYNRGMCQWKTHEAQKNSCKVSEPGPDSGERTKYPDATVPWSQGGQRTSSLTETPVEITRKVESAWVDVREKAKRIRQGGGVRIIAVAGDTITGEIKGDTGLYTSTVTMVPGTNQVGLATCSCPWETYRWARSGPWKKLEGRACAHVTALLFEMQSRKMFGGEITEDVATPEWRTEQPELENPKSRPGPWRLDVAASVQGHLSAITAQRDALEARAAVEVHLDPQVLSLGLAVAGLEGDPEGDGSLVAIARLTEARSAIDVPPFYAQVSGEIVVVDGIDDNGTVWANGRALNPRQILYPTFHPTKGLQRGGSVAKEAVAHTGVMVALVPSAELAAAISMAAETVDGVRPEPAEEIHLTLAYCGKANTVDRAAFMAGVQGIAAAAGRLRGKASGFGTFANEMENVLWTSVDIPGLDVMRLMVVDGLAAVGINVASNHGFTPHMTAGYSDDPISVLPSAEGIAGAPLEFDCVVAAYAGEWTYFDLSDPAGEPVMGETKTAMFEPRPDGEVLATEGEIVYRRKSMLGDNGIEAWMADQRLVGQLIWERSGEDVGEIQGVDVLRNYRNKGIATKMFELAKRIEPRVHHSHALTEDGKAWSKAVGASVKSADNAPGAEGLQVVLDAQEESGITHAGLVIKAADSGRVLMTQRTPYHGDDEDTYGKWEFPGGSIDEGEMALQAALREFREETGLELPEGHRFEGVTRNDTYLGIIVLVPNEAWTTNANLLPMETMGIGWFQTDHVEEEVGELTRPEMESTDWEMVREAAAISERPEDIDQDHGFVVRDLVSGRMIPGWYPTIEEAQAVADEQFATVLRSDEYRMGWHSASIDVEAEAEAILHDEPEPALPEALGTLDDEMDPNTFSVSYSPPNSLSPRSHPDDQFEPGEAQYTDPIGIDPRVAWLMSEPASGGDNDIALAAQAALSKMALKDFSIEEQHELINEGAEDHRGARNTDRLALAGTHYEFDAGQGGDELDSELLW